MATFSFKSYMHCLISGQETATLLHKEKPHELNNLESNTDYSVGGGVVLLD